MKKIAIDCRYIGKSGIGRVCEGILSAFPFDRFEAYLIGDPKKLEKYGAKVVEDLTDPYSVAGLRSFDRSLNKICDVYFTPNFLIPFGIRIPVHAIMHDLAFLDVKVTTRGWIDKLIKKTLLKRCMKRARSVSCVSGFTAERAKHYYGKLAEKCYVNYNGISESVFAYAQTHPVPEKENKIVYIGNVKPHKGLGLLLDAFRDVRGGTVLKIIGEKDNFLTGMSLDETSWKNVTFTGRMDDEELFAEIASAKYLVLPSMYEGFGLPPLEALCLGTQPIVSDIPVFREIYEGLPVKIFTDRQDLVHSMEAPPERICCLDRIKEKYRYQKCVEQILKRLS